MSVNPVHRVPEPVRQLWDDLGADTVLVGGSVRDLLLGDMPHDWDLASPLLPDAVERRLAASRHSYRVLPTGRRFGTLTVVSAGIPVEVTTFRQDGPYAPGGRWPIEVRFTTDVEVDLARRDFTVNAMALTADGTLVDPFGGRRDLSAAVVRAVGDPEARLAEDPLRLWRAVRFLGLKPPAAGRHWRLADDLAAALPRARWRLVAVSRERQRDELLRLLGTPARARALHAAESLGLLGVIWPEYLAAIGFLQAESHQRHHLNVHLRRTAAALPTPLLALAGLLHDIAKPAVRVGSRDRASYPAHAELGAVYATHMLERLNFSRHDVAYVTTLVREHTFPWAIATDADLRRLVRRLGVKVSQDLLRLHRSAVRARGGTSSGPDLDTEARLAHAADSAVEALAASGRDVMAWRSLEPGPLVGQILQAAREWVLEDPRRNTRDQLEAFVRAWPVGPGAP
jgi:tRNA nucleotidyltransferase (CCA-adding enzyme)